MMSDFKTDGHVVSNKDGHMGIFSCVNFLNDRMDEIESLKQDQEVLIEALEKALLIIQMSRYVCSHHDIASFNPDTCEECEGERDVLLFVDKTKIALEKVKPDRDD